jgi:putative NADH-flavin reductase
VIQESDLEWVIVRAPVLVEGEKKGEYRVGYVGKESGTRLSRADLADFMLKQSTNDTYLHRAPVISY